MIEIVLTSFPFVLRVLYLRWRGMPVTLYNVHRALFLWLLLALAVFFAVFYYHPKSSDGIVPFRIVPVVAERGGTVTEVLVEAGQRVEPGEVLFTTDDRDEKAAVALAQSQIKEVDTAIDAAKTEVRAAEASVNQAKAALEQANNNLADQEELRSRNSPAFRENDYQRIVNTVAGREAEVAAAQASLDSAQLKLDEVLPAQRATAVAALEQANVNLDNTKVRSQVSGVVEQLTLNVGARAGQTNLGPAMLIVPDAPAHVAAGFSQMARAVLHEGMAAEIVCMTSLNVSMTNAVLPARVTRIQNVIAAGQTPPTGQLLEPSQLVNAGSIVVHFALEHADHAPHLVDGSNCMVQTYTTHVSGSLEGTILAHGIETLGVLKALLLRVKAWVALAAGIGLGGGGH